MRPGSRWFADCSFLVAAVLLLTSCATRVALTPSPGTVPGIDMPRASGLSQGESTITVQSSGFAGVVNLNAVCCHDVVRNRPMPVTTSSGIMNWHFSNNPISLTSGGQDTTKLVVSIPMQNFGSITGIPFGKYTMQIEAKESGGTVVGDTRVGFRVYPASEPPSGCRPAATNNLQLLNALDTIIANAESASPKQSLVIAMYMPGLVTNDTWRFTIADDASLSPAETVIHLKSDLDRPKEITTESCSTVPKTVRVKKGEMNSMRLYRWEDRTLAFRKEICTGPFCSSPQWVDVALFSETLFWSVFGGKRAEFLWVAD